jgi:hypothetical protein
MIRKCKTSIMTRKLSLCRQGKLRPGPPERVQGGQRGDKHAHLVEYEYAAMTCCSPKRWRDAATACRPWKVLVLS